MPGLSRGDTTGRSRSTWAIRRRLSLAGSRAP